MKINVKTVKLKRKDHSWGNVIRSFLVLPIQVVRLVLNVIAQAILYTLQALDNVFHAGMHFILFYLIATPFSYMYNAVDSVFNTVVNLILGKKLVAEIDKVKKNHK